MTLPQQTSVQYVRVRNRGDCCHQRLNGFRIEVDGVTCASNVQIGQGQVKDVPCVGIGRVVKIVLPQNDYLTLCEVKVYGAAAGNCNTPPNFAAVRQVMIK